MLHHRIDFRRLELHHRGFLEAEIDLLAGQAAVAVVVESVEFLQQAHHLAAVGGFAMRVLMGTGGEQDWQREKEFHLQRIIVKAIVSTSRKAD